MILPETITLYLINYNKQFMEFNDNKIKFTSNEINTGVTNGREIIITRGEESMKTLLHECIHFYNLDFRIIPKYISEWIFKQFNLISNGSDNSKNTDILIFEAYTEFLASILHLLTKSVKKLIRTKQITANNESKQNTFISRIFTKLFIKQVIYTFNKFCQILAYSKCTSFNQFYNGNVLLSKSKQLNKKKQLNKDKCSLIEDTNVFCYYYLKLALYMNLISTMNVIDNNSCKFKDTESSFKKLLIIFKRFSNDELFCECMNKKVKMYNTKLKNIYKSSNKLLPHKQTQSAKVMELQSLQMVFID
jgi:hypothetical protein